MASLQFHTFTVMPLRKADRGACSNHLKSQATVLPIPRRMLIFFSFGVVVDYCFCTYLLSFTSGYCFFAFGDSRPPTFTHLLALQGFCADAYRFTLKCWLVAGGWCVGVGENNQSTYHRTHPVNHLPTNSHPSSHTHPTTMQGFCADVHR